MFYKSRKTMTKQEQIEEMAKDIVRSSGLDVYQKAEYLIDFGYNLGSKETAEKFVNETIKRKQTLMNPYTDDESECVSTFWIYKLAKQFGVEIKG